VPGEVICHLGYIGSLIPVEKEPVVELGAAAHQRGDVGPRPAAGAEGSGQQRLRVGHAWVRRHLGAALWGHKAVTHAVLKGCSRAHAGKSTVGVDVAVEGDGSIWK